MYKDIVISILGALLLEPVFENNRDRRADCHGHRPGDGAFYFFDPFLREPSRKMAKIPPESTEP